MKKIEAVSAVPMFAGLPPELRERILALCAERTLARGESLFLEGEEARGLFIIWKGRLKVYKTGEGGREQILEIEGPGRSVAELPLLDDGPYPASCAALEDSIVLTMAAATFHRLVAGEPALGRAVLRALAHRLRHMVGLVEELSLKAVRERLAGLLLELSGGRDRFHLSLNNQEVAARIGTVREIVSRTLHRMADEGALRIDGRDVTLLDRSRL